MERCPTCTSPSPHMHPAVQYGGEVELCTDEFHLKPTNQNTPERIASVNAKRREKALAEAFGDPREAREVERMERDHA